MRIILGAKTSDDGSSNSFFWKGTIYDCAVFDRQLTTEEIEGYLGATE